MRTYWTQVCRLVFPSIICEGPEPKLYLTFDDGPAPQATPALLSVLEHAAVHATFFLLGERAARYPDLVHRIADEGHVVGSHGFSHRSLIFRSYSDQERELRQADDAIGGILGTVPSLFRPPFGFFDHRTVRIVRSQNKRFVLWSKDPKDYQQQYREQLFERTINSVSAHDIILLHDHEATWEYLPLMVERFIHSARGHGFQFSVLIP